MVINKYLRLGIYSIYILTSKKTFSAAEDFTYAMQQAKRATIVGEVTGGGAHPAMPFSVGQGFIVSISFTRSLNPVTQTDSEGTGVVPDFKVDTSKALLKVQELEFIKDSKSNYSKATLFGSIFEELRK